MHTSCDTGNRRTHEFPSRGRLFGPFPPRAVFSSTAPSVHNMRDAMKCRRSDAGYLMSLLTSCISLTEIGSLAETPGPLKIGIGPAPCFCPLSHSPPQGCRGQRTLSLHTSLPQKQAYPRVWLSSLFPSNRGMSARGRPDRQGIDRGKRQYGTDSRTLSTLSFRTLSTEFVLF
jgi:hypothetical protein